MQKDNIVTIEKNFDTFHLTTTRYCGNMKDINERESFCNSFGIDSTKIVFAVIKTKKIFWHFWKIF